MRKSRLITLGIMLALLVLVVSLAGCYPTTTPATTSTDGTETTTSSWTSLLPMIGFIVILFGLMYFFTIRPQRKKQQEMQKMMESIQRGDKVITNAGIYGSIETIYEDSFLIRTESGATMRVAKWAVVGKQPEQTARTS